MPKTLASTSDNLRGMQSFSGVDIRATFANDEIGELQAISYSITREKAPVYVMGRPDPRAFSRGKRGIAGSLIFVNFDKHALLYNLAKINGTDTKAQFAADFDEERPDWNTVTGPTGAVLPATEPTEASGVTTLAAPWYADQIPPFDVTLVGANEFGAIAVMRIFGCDILNEGYGISIDDIQSEMQYTYVARRVFPWYSVQQAGSSGVGLRNAVPKDPPIPTVDTSTIV